MIGGSNNIEQHGQFNIIAATNHFSKEEVRELRESCEEEVKRLNGTLRLDDAVRWQNS